MFDILISLIELKHIHQKYQIKVHTCKFKMDKITNSKRCLEQHNVSRKTFSNKPFFAYLNGCQ